jgi:hypothetical protein
MIVFSPLLALPLLVALGVLCAAAVAAALLRRARGAGLRAISLLVLLLILSGPSYFQPVDRPEADIAVVVLDRSASMAIRDRTGLGEHALANLQRQAATLSDLQLRVVTVPAAAQGGTALFGALREALAEVPAAQRAGIILITDGEVSDAPQRNDLGAPVATLLTAKGEETDRELRLGNAPGYGLVGHDVSATFSVIDHGLADAGTPVPVTVEEDGAPIWSGSAPAGMPVTVSVPVRHPDAAIISVHAAALPGEVSTLNDQAAFSLNGVRRRLRVLLVSGSPNMGERTWRVLLKSDPAVQLVHFTILRAPDELLDAAPADLALVPFPVEQLFNAEIGKFDLIILDQFNASGLLPPQDLQNIAGRVMQGGALLAEVGPEFASDSSLAYTPLGPILPAVPAAPGTVIQPFTASLTALGARDPVTAPFAAAAMAPWYRQEIARPVAGDVLLSGANGAPLLILAKADQGRVGLLLSDQFWLWTRGGPESGPAVPLLRRCVHWLLGEPALEAEALSASVDRHTLRVERRTLSADNPGAAVITSPDGSKITLPLKATAPGLYTGTMTTSAAGIWRVAEGDLTAAVMQPFENALEYQDLAATAATLRPSSSRVVWLGRGDAPPLQDLLQRRHAKQTVGEREVPLLPPVPALVLATLALCLAWWRERGR